MTKVTKIYGPPGTGKTEKLIRRAMAYIRVGTPVSKIGKLPLTVKEDKKEERSFRGFAEGRSK